MERERGWLNSVRKRQLCSGDVGFVTWRSSSYTTSLFVAILVWLQNRQILLPSCHTENFYVVFPSLSMSRLYLVVERQIAWMFDKPIIEFPPSFIYPCQTAF